MLRGQRFRLGQPSFDHGERPLHGIAHEQAMHLVVAPARHAMGAQIERFSTEEHRALELSGASQSDESGAMGAAASEESLVLVEVLAHGVVLVYLGEALGKRAFHPIQDLLDRSIVGVERRAIDTGFAAERGDRDAMFGAVQDEPRRWTVW